MRQGQIALAQRDGRGEDRREGRADERDQVEHRHQDGQRQRVRDADHHQRHVRHDARDQADQQVAGDVAADGARDPRQHPLPPRPGGGRQQVDAGLHPATALAQEEVDEEEDRHRGDDGGEDAAQHADRRRGEAQGGVARAAVQVLARPVGAIGDRFEPERTAQRQRVADRARLFDRRDDGDVAERTQRFGQRVNPFDR